MLLKLQVNLKVNLKPHRCDKMYMDKDLIEDQCIN